MQHARSASDEEEEREALEYREDSADEQDDAEQAELVDEDRHPSTTRISDIGVMLSQFAGQDDAEEIELLEEECHSGDELTEEVGEPEQSDPTPAEAADGEDGEDEQDEQDPESLRAKHVSMPSDDFDDDERQGVTQVLRDVATQPNEALADVDYHPGSVSIDINRLSRSLARRREQRTRQAESTRLNAEAARTQQLSAAAGIDNQDAKEAEGALERVINKTDFEKMEILGQFNLGFIVTRRRVYPAGPDAPPVMDDLFIIDQHASDEKYNFETLQQTTRIRSQRLIHPRTLELAAPDELVAAQHQDTTLRANGFEVDIDPDLPAGSRVRLVAQPVSGKTVFGARDLEELLHELRESGAEPEVVPVEGSDNTQRVGTTRKVIRCPRMRAMFASRACRRSVMIGTALTRRQMRGIVSNMGGLEQPWNCPHGRPTMRHLACLKNLGIGGSGGGGSSDGLRSRRVDWGRIQDLD